MAAAAPTAVPPPQPRSSRWPSRYPLRRFPAEAVVVLAGYSLAVTSHTSHSGVRIGTWRRLTTDRDVLPRIFHSQKPRIRTKFVQNPWQGVAVRGKCSPLRHLPDLAHLVRTWFAVDLVEGLAEVVGQGLGGGDGLGSGLDLDGAIAAGGPDELADGPAGLCLDPA